MYRTPTRKKHTTSEFDLYDDLEKIKAALSDAAYDVRGRAGEVLAQSLEDIKDKSENIQHGLHGYIADRPVKTLGLTLLTGIVIGFFLHK